MRLASRSQQTDPAWKLRADKPKGIRGPRVWRVASNEIALSVHAISAAVRSPVACAEQTENRAIDHLGKIFE